MTTWASEAPEATLSCHLGEWCCSGESSALRPDPSLDWTRAGILHGGRMYFDLCLSWVLKLKSEVGGRATFIAICLM